MTDAVGGGSGRPNLTTDERRSLGLLEAEFDARSYGCSRCFRDIREACSCPAWCGDDDCASSLNKQAGQTPYRGMRLTDAQRDALERAEQHPRGHVVADPRTVRALLNLGLIHVGYYGECADGADFGPIVGPVEGSSSDTA